MLKLQFHLFELYTARNYLQTILHDKSFLFFHIKIANFLKVKTRQ